MYLQSYVVPVCLVEITPGNVRIDQLIGTAFFINSKGCFLTARHVIESAISIGAKKNLTAALVVKGDSGKSFESLAAPVTAYEFANTPNDVAIGKVNYSCETLLSLEHKDVEVWQEVATYGYPSSAVSGPVTGLRLNIRCHRGYIQRVLKPNDLPLGGNPEAFELDFLLGRGVSGAPLFIHAQPKDILIGVCVGSFRSELIEDELLQVDSNGSTYKELKIKIEEFGIAHDLRPLHGWRPTLLEGQTLLDACQSRA